MMAGTSAADEASPILYSLASSRRQLEQRLSSQFVCKHLTDEILIPARIECTSTGRRPIAFRRAARLGSQLIEKYLKISP